MPYHRLLGIRVIKAENGQSEVWLPFKEELLNAGGIIHGGALTSLVDATIGGAVNTVLPEGKFAVTAELNINFLSACKSGVIGRGKVIRAGRILVVGEAYLYDEREKLVAAARATFTVLER